MNRSEMLVFGTYRTNIAVGLIFMAAVHGAFAQQTEFPVPLKRMIVTLPTPAAAATAAGTPAGSGAAAGTGSAPALPSTVNVNITPTDRIVTTSKTTAAWVAERAPQPPPAGAQPGTTKKTVLNGTDECVTVSDVASPAKQPQAATAAAVLYYERKLTDADSDQVFTVTVDGDVTIELLSVVAFDSENRPIPFALELKPGTQQNQTKCPFTTAICAPATAGQSGSGAFGTGTGAAGTLAATGAGTSSNNATKPPATLRITIKSTVPPVGGVLRVTAPSKHIQAGTVTYHATGRKQVWRQIMIANGAQHSAQNTTGAQGGSGNQACGEANSGSQNQSGSGGQQTAPPPSWTVGAEVVVMDPTGKTVVLKGKLGTPVLCGDLAVIDDAIQSLDQVILAAVGRPDDPRTADAVLQSWMHASPSALVRTERLLRTVAAIESAIGGRENHAVNAALHPLPNATTPITTEPFQVLHKKIALASDDLRSVPEVVLLLNNLAVLIKAAGDHKPQANNDAHIAAMATLRSGTTEFENLRAQLATFTREMRTSLQYASPSINVYNSLRLQASRSTLLDALLVRSFIYQARLNLERYLARYADYELTSAETVIQRLAVEIDADHKYVDLGTLFGTTGSSAASTNIGQLPRVVRLVNTLALPTDRDRCASARDSVVIPAATEIKVDFPDCLRGTVSLASALPPGPAPPSGSVGQGLPPNNYCRLKITESLLNVAYLPVANTLDPGLRVLGASKKPAAAWLPLLVANGQLDYLQAEAFTLTTEPADNVAYFDSRAGQVALALPKTSKNSESIWSVSTSVANLTIDDTVDDWSTALNAISPNLEQVILAISEHPIAAGATDPDPDPALAGLCRLINLDPKAKTALAKVPNKSPRGYLNVLSQKLGAATSKAKDYDNLKTDESNASTQIALIQRQARQLKNRRGRDDFNPRLLELEIEREDQHDRKTDDHVRRHSVGGELLDTVGKF